MKLIKRNLIVYIAAIFGILIFFVGCNKGPEKVKFPKEKVMLTWNDSVQFKSDPFEKKVKCVVYLTSDAISEIDRWTPYIKKYPDIGFLFFFTSNDTNYIIKGLKHFSFPIPVFIDKKSKYEGYAFIAFVLNNKNEIVTTSNPTFSNFDKLLKSQLKKNK